MGINVTEERVKNNFHFPRIRDVVAETIQCCGPCQEKKMSQKAQRHTLISQQAGYPFQRISIDLVGPFQRSLRGNTHLLTVRDCFTRWIEAFPMRDTKAKALANVLSKQIFSRYGIPERVHSDQGANFTSDLLKAVYQSFGIQATTTPAYNPKSNPVERVHQDLGRMLRALCGKQPTSSTEIPNIEIINIGSRTTGLKRFGNDVLRPWRMPKRIWIKSSSEQGNDITTKLRANHWKNMI